MREQPRYLDNTFAEVISLQLLCQILQWSILWNCMYYVQIRHYRNLIPDDNKLCNNETVFFFSLNSLALTFIEYKPTIHMRTCAEFDVSGIHEWSLARLSGMLCQLWLGFKCQLRVPLCLLQLWLTWDMTRTWTQQKVKISTFMMSRTSDMLTTIFMGRKLSLSANATSWIDLTFLFTITSCS